MSAVFPRLEMRQGQSLVMTQQLQQSIKLLQLSSQELMEYIEQELEKNPLLSAEEEAHAEPEDSGDPTSLESTSDTEIIKDASDIASEMDNATSSETEWQTEDDAAGDSDTMHEPRTHSRINDEYEDSNDYSAVNKVTLRDHLMSQLSVVESDPVIRIVGQHLIDLVDEDGYIKEELNSLCEQLGCDEALIEKTFCVLHSFDPAGVCARNLKECLAIQLREKDRLDPAMQALLEHLDMVAVANITQLTKLCGVDAEDIKEMCAEIRTLNPRPGSGFQYEEVQAVIPEVIIRRVRSERWQIELNPAALPRVLVNRQYHTQLLTSKSLDKEEKKYISDQLTTANWLVKALDQRAQTILKVATEIVKQQEAFFHDGIKALRPLTLKDVAAATELHESTVSRVTNSKYMSTPRGTFELKYFFNASLQNSYGGEAFSNRAVQYLIKELIDAENPSTPLSDDTISEKLKHSGIEVARRTVAKYREIMNIPSSSQRRHKK